MTATHRSHRRLVARMLVACLAVGLVSLVVLAVEAAFFTIVSYGLLSVSTGLLGRFQIGFPSALVATVSGLLVVYVLVGMIYWTAKRSGERLSFALSVFLYTYGALLGASFVATLSLMLALNIPAAGFAVVITIAVALAYPVAGYKLAQRVEQTETKEDSERAETEDKPETDDTEEGLSRLKKAQLVFEECVRECRLLYETAGWVGVGAVIGLSLAGMIAVYRVAGQQPHSTVLVAVSGAVGVLVTAAHVGSEVYAELKEHIVLRELHAEFGYTTESEQTTQVTNRLAALAAQADMPVPDTRVVETEHPTAAAVGYRPESSTVVVSTGLLDALDQSTLDAVLAHELAHIKHRDAAVLTLLSVPKVLSRRLLSRYGINPAVAVVGLVAYGVSRLCIGAVARTREFVADDAAATITGDPATLAAALETIDTTASRQPETDMRTADAFSIVPPPWESHPLFDRTRRLIHRRLLGTHPPTEARIRRLRDRLE